MLWWYILWRFALPVNILSSWICNILCRQLVCIGLELTIPCLGISNGLLPTFIWKLSLKVVEEIALWKTILANFLWKNWFEFEGFLSFMYSLFLFLFLFLFWNCQINSICFRWATAKHYKYNYEMEKTFEVLLNWHGWRGIAAFNTVSW